MKCPKCGKDIANDSFFCEYCGVQVKPVKKAINIPLLVLSIIFGVGILGCIIAIGVMTHTKNELRSRLYNIETVYTYNTWTSTNTRNSTTSSKEYMLALESYDEIELSYEVSSEPNYDFLSIILISPSGDEEVLCKESGVKSDKIEKMVYTKGIYTLKVKYTKDSSYSKNRDRGSLTSLKVFKSRIWWLQCDAS